MFPILSHIQAKQILEAIKKDQTEVISSLDLNKTQTKLNLYKNEAVLENGRVLSLSELKKIAKKDNKCFLIKDDGIEAVTVFSEKTKWVRTLLPTQFAPTTLVSGILMHRIKNTNPILDSKSKINIFKSLNGKNFLDTSMGLGYTAIEAYKKGAQVTTVEIDPAALDVAKVNPWSEELFNSEIKIIIGDILEEIKKFGDGQFEAILHDQPTFKLAGELYSEDFYRQLFRVLRSGGQLFHYIGDPNSEHGSMVTKGVIQRLKAVGFKEIISHPEEFGVTAIK